MYKNKEGIKIYNLAKKLWPYNRSLTGDGNRKTLRILKKISKNLKINNFKSGEKVFDWKIPEEWKIKDAYIKNSKGEKILDFKKNNLILLGYSKPITKKISYKELIKKIYYLKESPTAIPYATSYYKKDWGFCMSYNQFKNISPSETFYIKIDSSFLKNGKMDYGEILIKGKSDKEVFISTYICHPSMANNELSGPCLSIYLAKFLSRFNLNYSYRFIFIPETIGSIAYLSKNLSHMKKKVIAGFNITCVAGKNIFSFLSTKYSNKLIDKITLKIFEKNNIEFKTCSWLERGSDERQYQSPFIDIPVVSIMRSKYNNYKEYHTSLDNLDFISSKSFQASFDIYKKIIFELEKNIFPTTQILCEPNLGKRNMYPKLSIKKSNKTTSNVILNFLTYCDGTNSLSDIQRKIKSTKKDVEKIYKLLLKKKIIK